MGEEESMTRLVCRSTSTHHHRYPTRSSLKLQHQLAPPNVAPPKVQGSSGVLKRGLVACRKNGKRVKRDYPKPLNLPIDVLFKILLLLPAKFLHEVIQYVCKEWCAIVKNPCFVRAHFENSPSGGMLVQHRRNKRLAVFVEFDTSTGLFELTNLRLPIRRGTIIGSCDGFVLVRDKTRRRPIFHVMNLVTNAKMTLPPIPILEDYYTTSMMLSVTKSGQYKVVLVLVNCFADAVRVMVYILGVDKDWRLAKLEIMPPTENALFSDNARSIGGFIYWVHIINCYCAVMDVDTEKLYHFPPPEGFNQPFRMEFPIYMERGFGLFVFCDQSSVYIIWELDLKTAKWIKVVDIDLFAVSKRLTSILKAYAKPDSSGHNSKPLSFKDGLLWFTVDGLKVQPLVAYNLSKEHFSICPVNRVDVYDDLFPHVNTMLSLKNC